MVCGELLKQAFSAHCPHDRNQISVLHFIIHEIGKHLARAHHVFGRDCYIVNYKRDDAPQVLCGKIAWN